MLIAVLALSVLTQDPSPAPPVIRLDPQVQGWLDRSPAAVDGRRRAIWDDGRVHGEVSVSVGSGGWRAWGGELDVPIGAGRMSLRLDQSEGGDAWRSWPYDEYDRDRRSPGVPRAMQERPVW